MNQDKIIHIYADIFEHVFYFAFFCVSKRYNAVTKRILTLKISSKGPFATSLKDLSHFYMGAFMAPPKNDFPFYKVFLTPVFSKEKQTLLLNSKFHVLRRFFKFISKRPMKLFLYSVKIRLIYRVLARVTGSLCWL